jgi:hypothetical protein
LSIRAFRQADRLRKKALKLYIEVEKHSDAVLATIFKNIQTLENPDWNSEDFKEMH